MRTARTVLALCLLGLLAGGCSFYPFNQEYEKGFLYSPLMILAANPSDGALDFAQVDHQCESQMSSSGGGGGSVPGCPT
jgi:hypothetical protein